MTTPNATREAALAAVQAWLATPLIAYDKAESARRGLGCLLTRGEIATIAALLAPKVLRLAERCAREGQDSMNRDCEPRYTLAEIVQAALTAEDRGTDGR